MSHTVLIALFACLLLLNESVWPVRCQNVISYENELSYEDDSNEAVKFNISSIVLDRSIEQTFNLLVQYYKLYRVNQLNSLQKSIIRTHLSGLSTQLLSALKNKPEYEKLLNNYAAENIGSSNSAETSKDKDKPRNPFKWGRK